MVALAVREKRAAYAGPTEEAAATRVAMGGGAASAVQGEPAEQLSEADLVRLWAGQRFPAAALITRHGAAVRVLQPGRRGRGAGPDFRGALIAAPSGAVVRGDVELHVRASDFRAHGHHEDARYNGVILHVVFEDSGEEATVLANGGRAPVVALGAWARQRAAELAGWLSTPALWREPCVHALERLGRDEVIATLDALGGRRFDARAGALLDSAVSLGAEEALYRALLAGIAYGGNAQLVETAERLPWRALAARLASVGPKERGAVVEALLLEAAGDALNERQASRPANRPARRLAGLARLLTRHHHLINDAHIAPQLDLPARELIAAWTVPAAGGALIGRGRAIELLVNAVLPWAAAVATLRKEPELAARARARFAELPRPAAYGALAFLERNLGTPLAVDARRQQGLLALYKTECTQGGCGRCVFS